MTMTKLWVKLRLYGQIKSGMMAKLIGDMMLGKICQ